MLDKLDAALRFQQEALNLRAQRQEVLAGNMQTYRWSINGEYYPDARPELVTAGRRVRLEVVNDTMMFHPMHLHGMWSDLEDENGNFQVRKHTIDMPPGTRRSYRVTADALGRWAYHCHLLYHMSSGMMSKMIVANVDGNQAATTPSSPSPVKQGDSHAQH